MLIKQIDLMVQAWLAEMRQAETQEDYLAAVRKICGLTQEANILVASTLTPAHADVRNAIELLSLARGDVATKLNEFDDEGTRRTVERIQDNIQGRIQDLRETSRIAELAINSKW